MIRAAFNTRARRVVATARFMSSSQGGRRDKEEIEFNQWKREDLPEDCVAAGLKVMRVKRWPRLPKGKGIDIEEARQEFMKRDKAVPGPYTIVVEPPKAFRARPPPPRELDRLKEYLKTPQYVMKDDDPFIQERLEDAWEVLGQNPRILEEQKEKFMIEHQKNLREIQAMDVDIDALFKIPPLTAEQIEQQAKETSKKAAADKKKRKKKTPYQQDNSRRR